MSRLLAFLLAAGLLTGGPLAAQPVTAEPASGSPRAPFAPGERMKYTVSYGVLPAGSMTFEVDDIVTYRGRPAYHIVFGGETNRAISFVYEYVTREESWFDAEEFHTLRYRKESVENEKQRQRDYRFDQARNLRIDATGEAEATSPRAVDPLAMMYFIRLLPLEPGAKFVLRNQADPADNPITLHVIRKERVKVPAGTFETYVVDLDVKTDSGVFKKGGTNRVWLTADERRVPVRITSKVGLGSFEAELADYTRGQVALAH